MTWNTASMLDGVSPGESTAAPFAFTWDTSTAPNGVHVLAAVARDAAGHSSTAAVSVTVENGAATLD